VCYLIVLNKILTLDLDADTSLGSDLIHSILDQLRQWRSDADHLFLLDVDTVPSSTWPVVAFNVEVATFMAKVVSRSSSVLTSDEWDFVLCSLVAWFQTVQSASLSHQRDPHVMALTTAAARLLSATAEIIYFAVPRSPDDFSPNLISEWQDVFSASVFEMALPLFLSLAAHGENSTWMVVRLLFVGKASTSSSIITSALTTRRTHAHLRG